MLYYQSNIYHSEVKKIISNYDYIENLKNKTIMITGARGLIGSELVDCIMYGNKYYAMNCRIIAVVRNEEAAWKRFGEYMDSDLFELIVLDINTDNIPISEDIDYFIHGASNTHPIYYSTKSIETILTNTVGTNNMLEYASAHKCRRFIFLSSVEIYGQNRGDVERFRENDMGYVDCNTLRAGYSEGKRLGEALCNAYIKEKKLDCVIPRLARSYGPGLLKEDSKALSQFLSKAVNKEDIVLKSKGDQLFSYVYVADVVDAVLFLLINGQCGEAYNVTGRESDATLAELARFLAEEINRRVIFDLPDEEEANGYSRATKALLDKTKLETLGWKSIYSIKEGLKRTLRMHSL